MLFVGRILSEGTIGIFHDTWAFVGFVMIVNDRAKLEPGEVSMELKGWNHTDVSCDCILGDVLPIRTA